MNEWSYIPTPMYAFNVWTGTLASAFLPVNITGCFEINVCRISSAFVLSCKGWFPNLTKGAPKAAGLLPPPPPHPQKQIKNTDFVDITISQVLRDFPFSQNQPLKSADD
jgi:hypothetical protein